MGEGPQERRLLAIVATDVVGYSRMMEADEAGTLNRLQAVRAELTDPLIAAHKGRIVKLIGDGALIAFDSVVDAVRCAIAIQKNAAARDPAVPNRQRLVFRVGVNLGDVVLVEGDLYGDGVNVAARLEQICPPGEVMVSGTAYDHLQGRVDLPLDLVGHQKVKNLSRPVRVYRVRLDVTAAAATRRVAVRSGLHRGLAAAVLVLALVTGGAIFWFRPAAESAASRPSIAVMAFAELGGNEATRRLAGGIAEDIITDLSRYSGFDVIARSASAPYDGDTAADLSRIAETLDVRYVLGGSVQREGESIRITAQLLEAASGALLWSDRWDRPVADVFAVQTEIAEQVGNRLGGLGSGIVADSEHAAVRRQRPENLSAYELFLVAEEAMQRPTRESGDEAVRLLTLALEEDPDFARAWTALAFAQAIVKGFGDPGAGAAMLAAAERSVELDPQDADAHAALGHAVGLAGDFARAAAEFDAALDLNPGSAAILMLYAGWGATFGAPERGAEAADRAIRLSPSYPAWAAGNLRYAYFMVGRYQDALDIVERQPPDSINISGWVQRAASYAALGRTEEASRAVADALARYPDLTIESYLSDPMHSAGERTSMIKTLRLPGLPACARPEQLARFANPVHLPECTGQAGQ